MWWGTLTSLLVVEVLLLTFCFDTANLESETGSETWVYFAAPKVFQIGLLGTMAALLLGGRGLWTELKQGELSGSFEEQLPALTFNRWAVFLPLHLASLTLFAGLSVVAFQGDLESRLSHPGVWACAWAMTGSTTLIFWALSCLSLSTWQRLLTRCWRPLLLGFALGAIGWRVGRSTMRLWEPLSLPTLSVVQAVLRLGFTNTVCDPARLEVGTTEFSIEIGPTCSGTQGLGLMAVFLAVYLSLFRRRLRFPAAFILLPVGMVGIWLLNALRIVLLITIGHWGWPDVALGGFHTQAGLLLFVVMALCLTAIAERSPWLSVRPVAQPAREPDVAVAYLGPFLALLATAMVTGAVSSGFDWLYPVRVAVVALVVWFCRKSYGELAGRCSWTALVLGAVTFVVWVVLAHHDPTTDEGWPEPLAAAPMGWAAAWLMLRVIGHVITVPLAEELAFRAFLIRQLTSRDFLTVAPDRFSWPAFVASSLLFGGLHGKSWLAGTLAGMLFALAQRHRGKIIDAVLAHATANALLAGYVLASARWSLW